MFASNSLFFGAVAAKVTNTSGCSGLAVRELFAASIRSASERGASRLLRPPVARSGGRGLDDGC